MENVWQVEGTARFGPNVLSFLITSGARQWSVVGTYVPPNDVPDVDCVEQALRGAPKGIYMILMGDLNARLGYPPDEREEDLATALVDRGLVNMTDHFMPGRWYRVVGIWTWYMQRSGRKVTGRGE